MADLTEKHTFVTYCTNVRALVSWKKMSNLENVS